MMSFRRLKGTHFYETFIYMSPEFVRQRVLGQQQRSILKKIGLYFII